MLVSVTTAARELGLSNEHLRRLINSGKVPFYKLGPRATRVDVAEIKNLRKLTAGGKSESEVGKQDGG